jgi:ribosome recycling factor
VGETKVQELTDAFIKKVDDLVASKEADIMTV